MFPQIASFREVVVYILDRAHMYLIAASALQTLFVPATCIISTDPSLRDRCCLAVRSSHGNKYTKLYFVCQVYEMSHFRSAMTLFMRHCQA